MVISGIIDKHNRLWVRVRVAGYHASKEIWFRIDTAFDGELSIPVSLAVPLGLALVGESEYGISGGGVNRPLKFTASIQWGTKNRLSTVDVDQTAQPLLGLGLLNGYILLADFDKKTLVIKEAENGQKEIEKQPEKETEKKV